MTDTKLCPCGYPMPCRSTVPVNFCRATPKQKLDALLGDAPRLEPNDFTTPMLKEER